MGTQSEFCVQKINGSLETQTVHSTEESSQLEAVCLLGQNPIPKDEMASETSEANLRGKDDEEFPSEIWSPRDDVDCFGQLESVQAEEGNRANEE